MNAPSNAAERVPGCRANWLRGCRWEARYDETPPSLVEALGTRCEGFKATGLDIASVIQATTPKTYLRDICTRCGATKERGHDPE